MLVVVPSDGASTTLSGAINDGGRTGSDAVQLTLSGSVGSGGALALSGSNSYSGGTTVSGGTLDFAVPRSLPGTGMMTVTGGGWVVLGNPSGDATLIGLLTAHSPLVEAAAPSLASACISGDAGVTPGVTSGSIPYPLSPPPRTRAAPPRWRRRPAAGARRLCPSRPRWCCW